MIDVVVGIINAARLPVVMMNCFLVQWVFLFLWRLFRFFH